MFECSWEREGFECWNLRGDLRGASRRWQHRLGDELWLWLNLSGQGVVWGKEHRTFLKPGLFGCFASQEEEAWKWTRLPGQHEGRILVIPKNHILTLASRGRKLDTRASKWLRGEAGLAFVGLMGAPEHRLAELLLGNWRSPALPSSVRRSLDTCLTGILRGAPQSPRIPRSAANGRILTRNQVSKMNPASHPIH
jgi:hypothetical protein